MGSGGCVRCLKSSERALSTDPPPIAPQSPEPETAMLPWTLPKPIAARLRPDYSPAVPQSSRLIADPSLLAVDILFFFPNRRSPFQLVDCVFARVERDASMHRGSRHGDGDLADTCITDAMHDRKLHRSKTLSRLFGDSFELDDRHLFVGFVREAIHLAAVGGPIAHDPEKSNDAAICIAFHRRFDGARIDSVASNREHVALAAADGW